MDVDTQHVGIQHTNLSQDVQTESLRFRSSPYSLKLRLPKKLPGFIAKQEYGKHLYSQSKSLTVERFHPVTLLA